MTKDEAIAYLNTIVPTKVDMVVLDAAKWAEFKTAALAAMNVTADPKYKVALEQVNTIVDNTLK